MTDFEVIDLDKNGTLICRKKESGEVYNCGETPEDFGTGNLNPEEKARLLKAGWFPYEDTKDLLDYVRDHVDNVERWLDPKMTDHNKAEVMDAIRLAQGRLTDIAEALVEWESAQPEEVK